jgi:6-phosphofructokinase 2
MALGHGLKNNMSNIITITFNPALDKSIAVPQLIPEKKLKCSHVKVEPGGGGINVSRAIHKLGGKSEAVFLSGGYTGKKFEALLLADNIRFVALPIHADTRENFIVFDEFANLQYRFGMDGPQIEEVEWQQVLTYLNQQEDIHYIVASGSLPPGVPTELFGKLAVIAKSKNAKLVVDTSGEALQYAVKEGVYLIKPNLSELSSLYGKEKLAKDEIIAAAQSIIHKGGCEIMVVSMGADGAMLVSGTEHYHVQPPAVTIHSTVGAGDSMVAGITLALANGLSYREALCYGVAAGTAATLNAGTELCKKEDTERIFAQLKQE